MSTTALIPNNLPIPSALGSLDAYISAVNQVPVLTVEQEQALARAYRDDEDLDAAKSLIMSHLRFVVHVARGYQGYGLGMGDLVQEGNIGLMKAVKRFDPDQGVRLVSFAVHWVRAEMHEFILRNWRIVKVATTKAQRKLFFNLRSSNPGASWTCAG